MSNSPSGPVTGKPIPAGQLTAYERWELPLIQGGGRMPKVEQKPAFKPPTAEDLERMHQEAHDEGFTQGRQAGFAEGSEQGRREGFDQGRQEGLQKGLADAKIQVDLQIAAMGKLMQSLLDPIATRQELVEAALVNLSMNVARSVIYRELSLSHETLAELVQQAFVLLPRKAKDVVLRINGADSKYVADALKSLALSADIRVDASVSSGGILVETSTQLFDFTLEKRFQKTVHAMLYELSQPVRRGAASEAENSLASPSDFPVELLNEAEQEAQGKASTPALVSAPDPALALPPNDKPNPNHDPEAEH